MFSVFCNTLENKWNLMECTISNNLMQIPEYRAQRHLNSGMKKYSLSLHGKKCCIFHALQKSNNSRADASAPEVIHVTTQLVASQGQQNIQNFHFQEKMVNEKCEVLVQLIASLKKNL